MPDSFDILEALNVLAHDYGLYAVKDRLDSIGFRAGPMRETYEALTDEGRHLYDSRVASARTVRDSWSVPYWAEGLIEEATGGTDA